MKDELSVNLDQYADSVGAKISLTMSEKTFKELFAVVFTDSCRQGGYDFPHILQNMQKMEFLIKALNKDQGCQMA